MAPEKQKDSCALGKSEKRRSFGLMGIEAGRKIRRQEQGFGGGMRSQRRMAIWRHQLEPFQRIGLEVRAKEGGHVAVKENKSEKHTGTWQSRERRWGRGGRPGAREAGPFPRREDGGEFLTVRVLSLSF